MTTQKILIETEKVSPTLYNTVKLALGIAYDEWKANGGSSTLTNYVDGIMLSEVRMYVNAVLKYTEDNETFMSICEMIRRS